MDEGDGNTGLTTDHSFLACLSRVERLCFMFIYWFTKCVNKPSCIQAEIYVLSFLFSGNGRHLRVYPLIRTSVSFRIGMPDPENTSIAVGIALLSSLGAEI